MINNKSLILVNRGEKLAQEENFEEAEKCFLQASTLNPMLSAVWCYLGQCQKFLKKMKEAEDSLKKALDIDPKMFPALYHLADLLFECGNYLEAKRYFEEALTLQPNFVPALLGLGRSLGKIGRFEKALKHFDSVVRQTPHNAIAWGDLGWALMNLDRREEAMKSLGCAISLDPNCGFAWLNLGIVQRRLGLTINSKRSLERATEFFPDNNWCWIEKGRILERLCQYQEAISCFGKAIKLSPEFALSWLELGWTHLESGQHSEALKALQKCLELDPSLLPARIGLGHALTYLGKVDDALNEYKTGFWYDGIGDLEIKDTNIETDAFTLWQSSKVFHKDKDSLILLPLAFFVHEMTFRLSQLSRRELGGTLIEVPYIYFCFYSELRERGGRKGKIIAKYLPQIWCVLGAQRSSTWGEIRLQNKIQDLKNPVRHLLNPEITRGFLHEAIGHCFEFPIFHWLIDSGKEIRGIEDILERSELPENIALYNTFSLASRACSEGFALWLLFYGEHILSKKNLWPSYLWKAERHKYLSMHRGNPYSVGLEAYETIENFAGEICALLSYLIAFDLPQKIIETKFNPDDEKTFFQKSINNPNFRLQSLTTMALPLDFRRNDGKRFIILAKKNIRAYCKKKPSCTLTGKMREADKSLDVQ